MSSAAVVLFFVFGGVAVLSAASTVFLRSPIRAALALLVHIVSLSGLFLLLHAHLLAALQMLVYAGAVVVLFVFVIMLIGPVAARPLVRRGTAVKACSGAVMLLLTALLVSTLLPARAPLLSLLNCTTREGAECDQFGGVLAVSKSLFVGAVVPFELVAVLLSVAVVGAVSVARGRTAAESHALADRLRSKDQEGAAVEARERALSARLAAPPSERGL